MFNITNLLRCLTTLALVGLLLTTAEIQAQSHRVYRTGREGTLPRPLADRDKAVDAARRATGGRVLGVKKDFRQDGQSGYRVRVLRDGRVRDFHYDPSKDVVRDR